MTKNWLILGAIGFGVGFSISLALERDIKRAALTGLIAIPATSVGAFVTDNRRRKQLNESLLPLQTRVAEFEKQAENLKQQKVSLETAIATGQENKQQVETTLGNLQIELSQLQNLLVTQQNKKSAIEQDLVELEAQKQQTTEKYNRLHTRNEELRQQELRLNLSLEAIAAQKQQLEIDCNSLQIKLTQLQNELLSEQQCHNREQAEQIAEKHLLETELPRLRIEINNLRQQETSLNQSLESLIIQKQQTNENLKRQIQELSYLQNQISALEDYRSKLTQNLADLEQQKHQLEIDLSNLKLQINTLENQLISLNQSILSLTTHQQEVQTNVNTLKISLSELQLDKEQLLQELEVLASRKEGLKTNLPQPQLNQPPTQNNSQELVTNTKSERLPNKTTHIKTRIYSPQKKSRTNGGTTFMNQRYTKNLWEDQILPHWSHRDRPAGHRFLGSIRIKRQATEQLLNIVGQNLQKFDRVTYDSLQDEFYELEQNWLKVLTVALSEYAYYYSSDRFWQSFCDRLDINHNQGVENTFRRVVDEGINLLGLVRSKGGYKYVSTLWLQSGVPEQNLEHFAQLVQEIADEYGWWELAHTQPEELSQLLLNVCEEKHPQWGTLINFLKSSCSEDVETEPVSGQLLQGVAIVAQELERQKASPVILKDEEQREEILGNYYLPQNFFLRNWDALTQVLTPRFGSVRSRSIVTRRSKPLFLSLDVEDSLNTQLLIPEQVLWKPEWRNLRGTYCQIPQANWENTIPPTGDLIIPELIIEVNQASEKWNCQLIDHNRQNLMEWDYKGINNNLPCLIFDALTGEHLPLNPSKLAIMAVEEVYCFTPKDIQPEFTNGIEVLDSYIPSSIRGWRGRHIRLIAPESSIVLTVPETHQPQLISWKLVREDEVVLTGLKLIGKKSIYLEPPTFWHPPINQNLNINVLVEDIKARNIIARTIETLSPNNQWIPIKLSQWITAPGCYEARFWFDEKRWSYRFEVKSKQQISAIATLNQLRITSNTGFFETDLPIKHNNLDKFWSEVIKIEGLWPLEEIILFLANESEKIQQQMQADTAGNLTIDLSSLYDLLPDYNCYALDYQRLGLEPQRLVEMQSLPLNISFTLTSQAIHLSGLHPNKFYSLSCWNLLLPDGESVEIKIPFIDRGTTTIEVPLNLPTGIYHIQLLSSQLLPKDLGWWCGSGKNDLPDNLNEDRENYCYTLLGNSESKESFIVAVNQLNLDFNIQQLQNRILALENNIYYFPEWLNRDALLAKLNSLLEILRLPATSPPEPPQNISPLPPIKQKLPAPVSSRWYLLNVRSHKRGLFLKHLQFAIAKNNLQEVILEIKIPQDSVYGDIVLVNLSNFKIANSHLQKIDYFQSIERQPLPLEQVSRMIGNQ
ncbi:chromosome partitioning protein ParA [Calothrix sp. NIES-2098]|uniref:chromosome partitioning protein ParA n=1 Tax=Calothrix sp. NIES-2098 TaxID=1954171 RepID=UPI000B61418A|nr:chromosome segregation ATPase-like protein [Calothrix sp. NIES-2098]